MVRHGESGRPAHTFLYGARMSWTQAPVEVAAWVEARLGSRVVQWSDRSGGMSTGIACVVTGDDGRSLFVKAVNGSENPFALQLLTREAELSARLPDLPGVPRMLDAGRDPGRRGRLVGDDHPGRARSRRPASLAPAGAGQGAAGLGSGRRRPARHALGRSPPGPHRSSRPGARSPPITPIRGSPLVTSWLDREARLIEVSSGSTHDPPVLSHLDLRADNIVLADVPTDQDVWFVDWAHPGLAARWVDLALLLADVVGSGADTSTGGPIDVMDVWRRHRIGSQCDPELLICVVSGLAAALHRLARRPVDPQLPHRSRGRPRCRSRWRRSCAGTPPRWRSAPRTGPGPAPGPTRICATSARNVEPC